MADFCVYTFGHKPKQTEMKGFANCETMRCLCKTIKDTLAEASVTQAKKLLLQIDEHFVENEIKVHKDGVFLLRVLRESQVTRTQIDGTQVCDEDWPFSLCIIDTRIEPYIMAVQMKTKAYSNSDSVAWILQDWANRLIPEELPWQVELTRRLLDQEYWDIIRGRESRGDHVREIRLTRDNNDDVEGSGPGAELARGIRYFADRLNQPQAGVQLFGGGRLSECERRNLEEVTSEMMRHRFNVRVRMAKSGALEMGIDSIAKYGVEKEVMAYLREGVIRATYNNGHDNFDLMEWCDIIRADNGRDSAPLGLRKPRTRITRRQ